MKELFIQRFAHVSATKLKDYLLGRIFNSYIDFINVHRYYKEVILDSPKKDRMLRNAPELRSEKHFELKASRYWIHITRDPQLEDQNDLTTAIQVFPDDVSVQDEIPSPPLPQHFEPFDDTVSEPEFDYHSYLQQLDSIPEDENDFDYQPSFQIQNELFEPTYIIHPEDEHLTEEDFYEGIEPRIVLFHDHFPNFPTDRTRRSSTERDHPDI